MKKYMISFFIMLLLITGLQFSCSSFREAKSHGKDGISGETSIKDDAKKSGEADIAADKYAAASEKKTKGEKEESPAATRSKTGEKKPSGYAGERPATPSNAPSASGLKAGFADDNKQFNYFISFLAKFRDQVNHIDIPVQERIRMRVIDSAGKPVANADVSIYDGGNLLCRGMTYPDGTFLFFPSEHEKKAIQYRGVVSYLKDKKEVTIDRRGKREIELSLSNPRRQMQQIPLDILFIMDTTGSMGEEIGRLKDTIEIINLNLASLPAKPLVRFGMVLYKDREDEYITRIIPLTGNLDEFRAELEKVNASGGGDEPEDLQAALGDAMNKIKWNRDGIRLCYIITDAPPHVDYEQKYTYADAVRDARSSGIKIFSVGTGGLNIMGEYILRQISQYTFAKYIFLTYGEKGETQGGKEGSVSHHTGSNFQTDKLESIIIRFTREELSFMSDKPLAEGEDYIEAVKIPDEKREETLQKLFDMAIPQLVDYSSITIEPGTTASIIPFIPDNPSSKSNAEYFTEQMGFSLSRNKTFKIVERRDMQKIFRELEIQQTGIIQDDTAVRAGKMMGARMIIIGRIYQKAGSYEIFLKLLRVETGEVLSVNKLKVDRNLGLQ